MDILDELLVEEASTYTNDELIVNADDRTIYIPNTLAGVTSDEKSTRLKLRCPRYVGDNIDLSTMNVYINFKNANGDIYSYLTDDVTVDGTDITFSWLLSRDVTTYKGNINFIVCAKKIQSDGKITIEWNTTLATLTVLEGLEPADSYIPTEKVDVATELMNAVNAVKAELNGVKDSIPVVPTKVSAFENDKNYLNAIPDEYVTEEELNAKDLANKTYVAEEVSKSVGKAVKGGETLSGSTSYAVTDSVDYPLVGLKVYGKGTQDGTPTPENPVEITSVVEPTVMVCGKNLLGVTCQTTTKNGITFTNNSDGTYTLNGTATGEAVFTIINRLNISGTYRIIGCPPNGSNGTYNISVNVDGAWSVNNYDIGNGSIINPSSYIIIAIAIRTGVTCNNLVFKPMLTTDLTATYNDFEQHKENTLSLPDTLNAIPVSSGGNVTIDGQEYIADYVDFERGVKVQRVKKIDLSSLSYNLSESGFYYITPVIENIKAPKANNIVANIVAEEYIPMAWDEMLSTDNGVAVSTSGQVIFANNKAGNPTGTMIYQLTTPTETSLSESELQAYRQLQTYNGVTNISNDKGAGLSVEYCTSKMLAEYALPIINRLSSSGSGSTSAINESEALELINTQLGVVENGTY